MAELSAMVPFFPRPKPSLERHQEMIRILTCPVAPFHRVLLFHEMGTGKTLSSICSTALWFLGSRCKIKSATVSELIQQRNELDLEWHRETSIVRTRQRGRDRNLTLYGSDHVARFAKLWETIKTLNLCGNAWIRGVTVITSKGLAANWTNEFTKALEVCLAGFESPRKEQLKIVTLSSVIKAENGIEVENVLKKQVLTEVKTISLDKSTFGNDLLEDRIVILDEAQLYTSSDIRTLGDKRVLQDLFRKYNNRIPLILFLSATPIQNDPVELGQLYNMLNPIGYRREPEGPFYKLPSSVGETIVLDHFEQAWRGHCSFQGKVQGIPTRTQDILQYVPLDQEQYIAYASVPSRPLTWQVRIATLE